MSSTYAPGRYTATPVLGGRARHLVSRFTYGVTPRIAAQVRALGGPSGWFEDQLAHAYDDTAPDGSDALFDWWPDLHRDPQDLWVRHRDEIRGGWEVMWDYQRRTMMRRQASPHQLLEVMTDFFENHLHVPANGEPAFTWRASYGDVIRRHALGRFEDMLIEAITHPAMLIFLDGATSTRTHPNENLGRELLELHTVGVGHYTEDDVKSSARILTGWSVAMWTTFAASYKTTAHWTGPVQVLGFSDPNAGADGRDLTRRYLSYLAGHPLTAQRLARKLALRFVSDSPSDLLVSQMAAAYLAADTAIVPMLRVLLASPEFWAAKRRKLRDPGEDVVATYRALDVTVGAPTRDGSTVNARVWQAEALGLSPLTWPRPDGAPQDNDAWASPGRVLASMEMHYSMSGGWWPKMEATYRTPAQWLPQDSLAFRDLVDHLSRTVLGLTSTAKLLRACCEATEVAPGDVITAEHGLVRWGFPRLLSMFLDHPAHFER